VTTAPFTEETLLANYRAADAEARDFIFRASGADAVQEAQCREVPGLPLDEAALVVAYRQASAAKKLEIRNSSFLQYARALS